MKQDSFTWSAIVVSLLFLFLAGHALRKGGISFGQPGKGARLTIAHEPIRFWIAVITLVLVAVFPLLIAIKHG